MSILFSSYYSFPPSFGPPLPPGPRLHCMCQLGQRQKREGERLSFFEMMMEPVFFKHGKDRDSRYKSHDPYLGINYGPTSV